MDHCCENKAGELAQLRAKQGRVLYVVLAINALMFVFEFVGGWLVGSAALLADSLDMLGDASVYALTLTVLYSSARKRAAAALFKGGVMMVFGIAVFAEALRRSMLGEAPAADGMALVGFAVLLANLACFFLLLRHRSDDLNMRSTWLCSRNDIVANLGVIGAAAAVAFTGSYWPDVLVGGAIALLFLHSAQHVLREAWKEWRFHGAAEESHENDHEREGEAPENSISGCCDAPPVAKQTGATATARCPASRKALDTEP